MSTPVRLYTPAEVAEMFGPGVDERKVLDWRRQYGWPCVKSGRVVRFTADHLEQIVQLHSTPGTTTPAVVSSGQTKRSASRRSA